MKYYIIAGEASGDLHGSNLIKGLLAEDPGAEVRFWGGPLMAAAAGCEPVVDYRDAAVMGYLEVLLKSFTIISQQFHNERALYQAEHLELDLENIQAYNAKNPKSTRALITYIREYLARVKLFWDILIM